MSFFVADVGVKLEFTIKDQASVAVNLASTTVELLVFGVSGPFNCVVDDAPNGKASYTITAASTFPSGNHSAQLKLVTGGNTFHSAKFTLSVKALLT